MARLAFNAIIILFSLLVSWGYYFVHTGDAFIFHTVPEGHVGVYRRWGAILEGTTGPGLHFMNPFTTRCDMIQITLQTDTVSNIPCGTSGGVNIYFDKIEVVNRLDIAHVYRTVKDYGVNYDKTWIFDKIHHEINQFCSSHTLHEVYIELFDKEARQSLAANRQRNFALLSGRRLDESLAQALQADCDKYDTGISIIAIRVTKPVIPPAILKKFQKVEEKKAKLLVLAQEQAAATKAAETASMQAQMEAERQAKVAAIEGEKEATISKINQQQKTAEVAAEAERKATVSKIHQIQLTAETVQNAERERIRNQVKMEVERDQIQTWFEQAQREAEIQQLRLTPEFLEIKKLEKTAEALQNTPKVYFGESVPDLLEDIMYQNNPGPGTK